MEVRPDQPGPSGSSGGPNGAELTAKVDGHLDYLSQLAKQLGVNDPVESYLVPVLGKWSDLHDEAGRWRAAAQVASSVTSRLTAPLGGLDAAWQGADADSFLEYMRSVGLAGHDLADALGAMADALDKTADGIRQIASEMVDMLADTAEQSSDAMTVPVGGAARARQHLDELDEPGGKLYESVRDVLDAFVKLCNGVQGGQLYSQIAMAHRMPAQNWSPAADSVVPVPVVGNSQAPLSAVAGTLPLSVPPVAGASSPSGVPGHPSSGAQPAAAVPAAQPGSAVTHAAASSVHSGGGVAAHAGGAVAASPAQQSGPAPESAAVAAPSDTPPATVPGSASPATADSPGAGAAGGGGSGMPMGMGGMGGARGGGGDAEHKSKIRITGDPREIFGKPDRTAPPTIGEE